ncbi:MAG: HYExAFE family protein [Planctomycetota bacterium]
MKRCNHYETAFESYLRQERLAYVAVNEQRRSLTGAGSLKSVDFIVSPSPRPWAGSGARARWLIDVKGRAFPSGRARGRRQYWRNWVTSDDIRSLTEWSRRFGDGFEAAFVFAYWLRADRSPTPPEQVLYHQGRPYAFVAVRAADYADAAKPLSKKWGTASVPVGRFREIAVPVAEFLHEPDTPGTLASEGSGTAGEDYLEGDSVSEIGVFAAGAVPHPLRHS